MDWVAILSTDFIPYGAVPFIGLNKDLVLMNCKTEKGTGRKVLSWQNAKHHNVGKL